MDSNKNQSKAINLANVHLSLGSASGTIEILRGINLTITEGETVSIIGPSGSGKTSLLMILAGLEPATDGEVIINGQSLLGFDEDTLAEFRRDHIGIVFQSFHLVPTMTALENVALPLEFAGYSPAFERAEAELSAVLSAAWRPALEGGGRDEPAPPFESGAALGRVPRTVRACMVRRRCRRRPRRRALHWENKPK